MRTDDGDDLDHVRLPCCAPRAARAMRIRCRATTAFAGETEACRVPPDDARCLTQTPPFWQPDIHADRRPSSARAGASRRRCGAGSRRAISSRSRRRSCRSRPATRRICTASPPTLIDDAGASHPYYLHTSPEFAAKKLLAAGETRIFDFARVFRNRERTRAASSRIHDAGMVSRRRGLRGADGAIARQCWREAARGCGCDALLQWRGVEVDPFAEPERLTLQEAFARHAGIDLLAPSPADGDCRSRLACRRAAAARDPASPTTTPGPTSSAASCRRRIEPHLGRGRATILCDYPISEAALARPQAGRSARGRALRALCLRRRARQRFR